MADLSQILDELRALGEEGNPLAAREVAKRGLDEHPESALLRAHYASALLWSGDPEGAHEEVRKALEQAPDDAYVVANAAENLAYEGRLDQAAELAEKALRLNASAYGVLLKVGSIFALLGETDRAMQLSEDAQGLFPDSPLTLLTCVNMYHLLNENAKREAAMAEMQERFPDYYGTQLALSRKATSDRNLVEAEHYARYAVASGQNNPGTWAQLALVLVHQDRLVEAEQMAGHSLEINRYNQPALRVLATVARKRGDQATAAHYEEQAAKSIPGIHVSKHIGAGILLARQGHKAEALVQLEKGIAETNHAFCKGPRRMVLGLLADLNRWDELERKLAGFQDKERDDEWHACQARLLHHKGQIEAAIQALRDGIAVASHGSACRCVLLRLLNETQRTEELEAEIQAVLAQPIGLPSEAARLVVELIRLGQTQPARTLLFEAKRQFPNAQVLDASNVALLAKEGRNRDAIQAAQALHGEFRQRPNLPLSKLLWTALRIRWRRFWKGKRPR